MLPVPPPLRFKLRKILGICVSVAACLWLTASTPWLNHLMQAVATLFSQPALAAETAPAAAVEEGQQKAKEAPTETLSPRMRTALDYASKRYRVSAAALEPVFAIVQATARDLRLDPLLIVAVIAIESRFNPLSQSQSGAQGLMQLIPRYHRNRLPPNAGKLSFFDPVINVRIGSQALYDFIRSSGGSVAAGLQRFAGESDDPEQSYSNRVLAERDRLAASPRRGNGSGTGGEIGSGNRAPALS